MIEDGVKGYVNGREIIAPVKLENKKVSILLTTSTRQREWILLEDIADALGGKAIWDDTQKSARMVIR